MFAEVLEAVGQGAYGVVCSAKVACDMRTASAQQAQLQDEHTGDTVAIKKIERRAQMQVAI